MGPYCTFACGRLENLSFFVEILCQHSEKNWWNPSEGTAFDLNGHTTYVGFCPQSQKLELLCMVLMFLICIIILYSLGVSVEMPPLDSDLETITLRGEPDKLGQALTQVYEKASSVVSAEVDAPRWLHRFIIGRKGQNIRKITQDLPKVFSIQCFCFHCCLKANGMEVATSCLALLVLLTNLYAWGDLVVIE